MKIVSLMMTTIIPFSIMSIIVTKKARRKKHQPLETVSFILCEFRRIIYIPDTATVKVDGTDDEFPDDDPRCIEKRRSQDHTFGKEERPAAVTLDEALAFALRRIQLLEQQFDHTEDSIREIRKHENLRDSNLAPPRKQNDGCKLVHALARIHELEFQFGWIRNAIHEIEEYLGFDTFPYPRLQHRWEGPPPDTFQYHGVTYYDV
jgi:hypothetical protein